MNTIHSEGEGEKIWEGEYFGPSGALAESRETLYLALRRQEQEALALPEIGSAVRSAHLALMSTTFSALSHCRAQMRVAIRRQNISSIFFYGWQGIKLLCELESLTHKVMNDTVMRGMLAPSERDVFTAALIVTSPLGKVLFCFSYGKEAAEEIERQIKSLPVYHVSSLFAKARGYSLKEYFSEARREAFQEDVIYAIRHHSPESAKPTLSWTDVARLARLVGDRDWELYAANMSGKKEAKLKAGLQ